MIGSIRLSRWVEDRSKLVLHWAEVETPVGPAVIVKQESTIVEWWFTTQKEALPALQNRWLGADWAEDREEIDALVEAVFSKEETIDMDVALRGTDFQYAVWSALLTIASGEAVSYADVAKRIGRPKAVRAVASAIGQNPVSYMIPCHRVIYASGEIGQYRWGSIIKRKLLALEKN